MTPQELHIDRIQKYLRGELPPNEMKAMETNIQQNPELAQEVADYQFLIEGVIAVGAADFEAKVRSWEEKYKIAVGDFEEEETYTLEELMAMFQPVKAYENRIAKELVGTRSAGGLKVSKPENGVDCLKELVLELENPVNDVLKFTIEDSEEDEIFNREIAANTSTFTIDLTHYNPGRYYWKLRSKKYGMVLRSFFVKKYLMP